MIPDVIRGHRVTQYAIDLPRGPLTILGPHDPDGLLDDPRTVERFHAEGEHMPYWARPWAAAVMLAEFVQQRPGGAGRRALEIGCGLGLAGLAAAMHGWRVTLTDYEDDTLAFVEGTARANQLLTDAMCRLDWRAPPPAGSFDLVLAADVLFEQRWVGPVADFLAAVLAPHSVGLVADPNRGSAGGFADALADRGFLVRRHAASTSQPDGELTAGTIYEVLAMRQ